MEEPQITTPDPATGRERLGGSRGKMNDKQVKAARYPQAGGKRPIRMGTGRPGLYLQIAPPTDDATQGTKSWLFRFTLKGRSREMGLGAYPEVSLGKAADAADAPRELLKRGIDPLDAKRDADQARRAAREAEATAREAERAARENSTRNTFEHVAGLWFEEEAEARWKTERRRKQTWLTLKRHAFPQIGKRPVADIGHADIEAMLAPIWGTRRETADRLRWYVEKVLDYAHDHDLRPTEANPARRGERAIRKQKRREKRKVRHQPALPYQRAPEFYRALLLEEGAGASALRLQLLTAVRPSEAREARWGEFDLDARRWTIPESRTKMEVPHVVPLADPVVAFLRSIRPENPKADDLLFRAPRGGAISDMTMLATIKRMNARCEDEERPAWTNDQGERIVPHGFRSTFRVWCEEAARARRSVSEAALAHRIADSAVEGAYLRGTTLLTEREPLMQRWAAFVTKAPAEVVQLHPAAEARAS